MATQMLDDQLSHDIDVALNQIHDLLPFSPDKEEKIKPPPTPVLPRTTFTPPVQSQPLVSLAPPQLPALEFPSFGLDNIPKLYRDLTPPMSPPPPNLPSWCPALPCFTRNGLWPEGRPVFYDLSSLPEPKKALKADTSAESKGKELQLWRSNPDRMPKKSRFFPRPPSPAKPVVKLPPTACKLHLSEQGLTGPLAELDLEVFKPEPQPDPIAEIVQTFKIPVESRQTTPVHAGSAATLWHILDSQDSRKRDLTDPYVASFAPRPENHQQVANWHTVIDELRQKQDTQALPECDNEALYGCPYTSQDDADDQAYLTAWQAALEFREQINDSSSPTELDGKELPHANSLVGYANEIALSPYAEEHPLLPPYTPLASPSEGLNELMMDHDIFSATPLDSSVPAQPGTPTSPLLSPSPTDNVSPVPLSSEVAQIHSDAHFQSEKSLFALPALPESPSPRDSSIIDVAAFLKLGHATRCWCGDCSQGNHPGATTQEEESSLMESSGSEDDWVVYSPLLSTAGSLSSASGTESCSCGADEGVGAESSSGSLDLEAWGQEDFLPPSPASPESFHAEEAVCEVSGPKGGGFVGGFDLEEWEVEF